MFKTVSMYKNLEYVFYGKLTKRIKEVHFFSEVFLKSTTKIIIH